jgi:hypothetical protein
MSNIIEKYSYGEGRFCIVTNDKFEPVENVE